MTAWPEDSAARRSWLARPALEVAPELLGWRLSHTTHDGTVTVVFQTANAAGFNSVGQIVLNEEGTQLLSGTTTLTRVSDGQVVVYTFSTPFNML